MTDRTQSEAGSTHIIRYALELGLLWIDGDGRDKVREALDALDALEAKLEAIVAGGAQALSAAPAGWKLVPVEPSVDQEWAGKNAALRCSTMGEACKIYKAMLAASPPAEQQAAPKAAPGVGNSGFDHQTAADFLSGKTVSDEAVRKFVQASRWAHDEKAALNAMLLSVRGVLASREAEIALLKKALMEAEAAPQPAPAPLSEREAFESTWEKLYSKKPVLWDTAFKEAKMDVPSHSAGKYFYRDAQAAWEAWQARAALAAQGGK